MPKPKTIFILGPTASGKTALALQHAQDKKAEIINADSKQLYGALPLLTALPTPEEQALVPHHLYGILEPKTSLSVAGWCELASQMIRAVHARGHDAILVGGTGFYFKALSEGLHHLATISPSIQHEAQTRLDHYGPEALHRWLAAQDPAYPPRCAPQDTHRVLRNLAIYMETGCTLGRHLEGPRHLFLDEDPTWIIVDHPRTVLRDRILERAHQMMAHGALEEVRELFMSSHHEVKSFTTIIGFQDWRSFLKNEITYEAALTSMINHTCQYAKRQQTWLRHQLSSNLR